MITLLNIKTKVQKVYTNKKAELIMGNPLVSKDFKVISTDVKIPDPPEVAKVSINKKPKKKT